MNIGNPYSSLIKIIREQGSKFNPPSIQIGNIVSVNPLTVTIGELQLTENNLLIADYLLDNTVEMAIPQVSATGTAGNNNISDIGIADGVITLKSSLKKGDIIALIQINSTAFLILCKVVRA